MFVRIALLFAILPFLFAAGMGCGSPPRPVVAVEETYPVRNDWLLVGQVPGDPSHGLVPGYPPYLRLREIKALKTDPTDPDDRILKQATFFDARTCEPEVRDELSKVLTRWFGTPAKPTVLPLNDDLRSILEGIERLPRMREDLAGRQMELAELKKTAKAPDEWKSLEEEIRIARAEIQTREATVERRIEDLRTAVVELRLDEPTLARGGVVFRNYCQQCHGLTGDGNGPVARNLVPMPRDYRQGLFKYITSHPKLETKRKPLRSDLRRTIVKGLDGSPMPQFAALGNEDIEAVISYVIHLSIRGEAEYEALRVALDDKGDGLAPKEVEPKVIKDAVDAALLWLASSRTPISSDADSNPYHTREAREEAAARGYRLFTSAEIGCAKCHTNFGRSAPFKYDAWGTIIRPRNLTVATLRGGREPDAIYARIFGGIPGTGMPAHAQLRPTDDEKAKGVDKLWDLVYFVINVSESEKRRMLKDKFQIEIDE